MLSRALPILARFFPAFGRAAATAPAARRVPMPMGVVLLLLLAFILPGLVGHEPWKPDEAYLFGIIHHMLSTGDWVVPYAGGIAFLEKPPLYAWTGVLLAKALSPWLPSNDAARLASGLFVAIAFASTAVAARLAWGKGHGRVAALLLAGTLGLFGNAQLMITDLPLLAGFALAGLGFVAAGQRRSWAGVAIGAGVGMGFLAKGLIAPGVMGLVAVLLPIGHAQWRTRNYAVQLAVAFVVALPALVAWPWLLHARAPDLFREWLWENNIGRFVGFSVSRLGAATERGFYLRTFAWALFPAGAFAAIALWRRGRKALDDASLQATLSIVFVTALVLVAAASARVIYVLPMLPALAVAGAAADEAVLARFDRYLLALGTAIGATAIALVWIVWGTLVVSNVAPGWGWLTRHFPAHFAMPFVPIEFGAAIAITAGFLFLAARMRGRAHGGLAIWVGGLATAWGLAMTLALPWIDEAKSFRAVFREAASHVPPGEHCVVTDGLGESERSMLDFYTGIPLRPAPMPGAGDCGALLRQWKSNAPASMPGGSGWRLAWSGARPGEMRERFDLYLRSR